MRIVASVLSLMFATLLFAGNPVATVDKPAPDFKLVSVTGDTVRLSDYAGKTVVLEWVNYDCPFVKKHYGSGNMQNLQNQWMKEGIIWLAICSSAPGKQGHFSAKGIQDRMNERKSTPTAYLIDETGETGKAYGAKTTPHMYVINSQGILVYAGAIDNMPSTDPDDVPTATNYVTEALKALTADKPVAVKETKAYGCSVKY